MFGKPVTAVIIGCIDGNIVHVVKNVTVPFRPAVPCHLVPDVPHQTAIHERGKTLIIHFIRFRVIAWIIIIIISYVIYTALLKLAIGEVDHQLGVVKFSEWTGRTSVTLQSVMFEVRICDAPLFQICWNATSSSP